MAKKCNDIEALKMVLSTQTTDITKNINDTQFRMSDGYIMKVYNNKTIQPQGQNHNGDIAQKIDNLISAINSFDCSNNN